MSVDQLRQALARAEREEISDDDRRAVPRLARSKNLAPLVCFAQKRRATRREDAFDQRLDESFVALRDQPDAVLPFAGHIEIGDLVADHAVRLVVLFDAQKNVARADDELVKQKALRRADPRRDRGLYSVERLDRVFDADQCHVPGLRRDHLHYLWDALRARVRSLRPGRFYGGPERVRQIGFEEQHIAVDDGAVFKTRAVSYAVGRARGEISEDVAHRPG